MKKYIILGGLLLIALAVMFGLRAGVITAKAADTGPTTATVPFWDDWFKSGHNKADAEAFKHWDAADPKEVPVGCATCHSTPGYQDFLGVDGSAAGKVDKAAPIGTTIQCVACHNAATAVLTSVTFPSGAVVNGLGAESRCMICHQGRSSMVQVDKAITDNGGKEDADKVLEKLSFVNIHYRAAAATLYGGETMAGYQYTGKSYDAKNDHVAGYSTCVGCHSSHTLAVKVDKCAACHQGVKTVEDLKKIRMADSEVDYNGNGDTKEGLSAEITGLQDMLLKAIVTYGKEVTKAGIVYDGATYPYFITDANNDGKPDVDDKGAAVSYKAWTGRLERAAYNYQFSLKDTGQYAHGGKYVIQLLYDSIEDLNTKLTTKVDLSKATRDSAGHFLGSAEAFRHWDGNPDNGTVPSGCAKCHSATGLPFLLKNGVMIAQPASNGLNCATCHNDLTKFTRYEVKDATFPSGAKLAFTDKEGKPVSDANLCINCHQGRESTVSLDKAITTSKLTDDQNSVVQVDATTKEKKTVYPLSRFTNPHYFAAGATLFGTQAKGAYEYKNQKYNGQNTHVDVANNCVGCHDVHSLTVQVEKCAQCHAAKTPQDLLKIQMVAKDKKSVDFAGDKKPEAGIGEQIQSMEAKLLIAMQDYAKTKLKSGIVYNGATYPYFLLDANNDGKADTDDKGAVIGFAAWSPRLLRAAYNYQWVQKDPGAFAHNGKYILQVLYDTLKDVGGMKAVTGMTRPLVTAPVK